MSVVNSLDTVPMTCCISLQMEKLLCKQAQWEQCKPANAVMNPMQKIVYSQTTLQKPSARPKNGGFIQLQKSWNHVWGHTSQWAQLPDTTSYKPIWLSTTTSMYQKLCFCWGNCHNLLAKTSGHPICPSQGPRQQGVVGNVAHDTCPLGILQATKTSKSLTFDHYSFLKIEKYNISTKSKCNVN